MIFCWHLAQQLEEEIIPVPLCSTTPPSHHSFPLLQHNSSKVRHTYSMFRTGAPTPEESLGLGHQSRSPLLLTCGKVVTTKRTAGGQNRSALA